MVRARFAARFALGALVSLFHANDGFLRDAIYGEPERVPADEARGGTAQIENGRFAFGRVSAQFTSGTFAKGCAGVGRFFAAGSAGYRRCAAGEAEDGAAAVGTAMGGDAGGTLFLLKGTLLFAVVGDLFGRSVCVGGCGSGRVLFRRTQRRSGWCGLCRCARPRR